MKGLGFAVLMTATSGLLGAQQNPFKAPKLSGKAEVNYEMTGDMKGTAVTAFDGERFVTRSTGTVKMMGKEQNSSNWSLVTADSMYSADLVKKRGYQSPNLLPYMAKAYDDLDGDGKKRLHQNIQDMAGMLSRAFDLNSLSSGEKRGERTIAGELCEERQFGSFTICTMKKGPRLALETSGDLVCYSYKETATSVNLSGASADVFARPEGVTFEVDSRMGKPDSIARGFVTYLASQALSDSMASAKKQLEEAKAKAQAEGKPTEVNPEQMKQACDVLKNLDVNKMMADAANAALKALGNAAVDAAKQGAVNKLKGLIKKPRIP